MATLEPGLNSSSGSDMTPQPAADYAELASRNQAIGSVWLSYPGIRHLSDLLGEAEGDVLGVVIGSHSPAGTIIHRYEPLREDLGTDPGDVTAVRDCIRQLTEKCVGEASPETGEPVGLFRTQQGGSAAVTDFDNRLVHRSFPLLATPGNFFLLIRNFDQRPRSGALFALEEMSLAIAERPALEFPFDEYLLRKGILTNASDQAKTPALPLSRPMHMQVPLPAAPAFSRGIRTKVALLAAVLVLALLVGAGAWKWSQAGNRQAKANPPEAPAPSRLLALKVARSGSDMEISWDRFSEAMNNASGTLTIRDGPVVRVVALNSNQLREGHIWFSPLPGSDLDLRLEIVKKDGKTEAESVQVLNWDRSSPGAPPSKKNSSVAERWKETPAESSRKVAVARTPVQSPVQPPSRSVNPPAAQVPPPTAPQTAAKSTEEPSPNPPPRTSPAVQTATADVAKPAPAPPTSSAAPSSTPVNGAASNPPLQSASLPVNNPVEQIPIPRNVPASPAPPVVEAPKVVAPPAQKTTYVGPTVIRKVNPSLTQEARGELRRTNRKVTVTVRLDIDDSGNVRNADVVGMTGEPSNGGVYVKLVAMAAARQWKFRPATINGKNVASQMTVAFEY
jgi:hypothetical protein